MSESSSPADDLPGSRFGLNPKFVEGRLWAGEPLVQLPVLTGRIEKDSQGTRCYSWFPLQFLIDTGADISMFPRSIAQDLKIPINTSKARTLYTVEGKTVGHLNELVIWYEGEALRIPCALYDGHQCLIGRAGFLDLFGFWLDGGAFGL